MVNFDAVDFSERHSEEVMFLSTLSVVYLFHVGRPANLQRMERLSTK